MKNFKLQLIALIYALCIVFASSLHASTTPPSDAEHEYAIKRTIEEYKSADVVAEIKNGKKIDFETYEFTVVRLWKGKTADKTFIKFEETPLFPYENLRIIFASKPHPSSPLITSNLILNTYNITPAQFLDKEFGASYTPSLLENSEQLTSYYSSNKQTFFLLALLIGIALLSVTAYFLIITNRAEPESTFR